MFSFGIGASYSLVTEGATVLAFYGTVAGSTFLSSLIAMALMVLALGLNYTNFSS